MKYERATELLEAEVGEELVALDAEAGNCFGFNETATAVWRLLEAPMGLTEIVESLVGRFEIEGDACSREVEQLIGQLEAAGLVRKCPD